MHRSSIDDGRDSTFVGEWRAMGMSEDELRYHAEMIALLITALLLSSSAPVADDTDYLVLPDGKEVACRVLYENDQKVVYTTKRKIQEIALADVAEVHSVERSLRKFLEQFDALQPGDTVAMAALAEFCEAEDLPGEARNMWMRIITVDPLNEQAWTKLGGSKNRKGWRLKVRGRFYTLERLRERVSDWKNAMELPTAHFLLKTDVSPERALDMTINLERAYLAYYDAMRTQGEIYAFDKVPEVHVFAEAKQYPTPPTPRDAWFSITANTTFVNAAEQPNSHEVMLNFSYGLIFNSYRRTLGQKGAITPWARRGIAEVISAAFRPSRGHASWDFNAVYRTYFENQVADEDALSLKQILRAGRPAFNTGTNMDRHIAASYTLTHFLLHGADGKYREKFGEFLRSSFGGQGSATHFRKIMDVDMDAFELEWKAYVSEVAEP